MDKNSKRRREKRSRRRIDRKEVNEAHQTGKQAKIPERITGRKKRSHLSDRYRGGDSTTKRKNSAGQRRNDRTTKQGKSRTDHCKKLSLLGEQSSKENLIKKQEKKQARRRTRKIKDTKDRAWQSKLRKRPIGRHVTEHITTGVHPGGLHNRQGPAGAGRSSHVPQTHAQTRSTGAGASAP